MIVGSPATISKDANVEVSVANTLTFVPMPAMTVEKTANPISLPEPGGDVDFTVRINNTGNIPLNLTSLSDDIYGDLANSGNLLINSTTCIVPQSIPVGSYYECTFNAYVIGNAGSVHEDTVTATANELTASDDATVTITDVLSAMHVMKTAGTAADGEVFRINEPGGWVTFYVTVYNDSTVDAITITSLDDDIYGDLTLAENSTCVLPQTITVGKSYSCSFGGLVSGESGQVKTDVVTASGNDDDNLPLSDTDDAQVALKDVMPTVTLDKAVDDNEKPEPGGVFTFTLTITNNSVETVEITALTDTNALSAQCTGLIGTFLAAGASTSCSYTVTHTEFGSYENTASVTVEDNEGNSDTATDTETVTVTDVLPDVMLDKTVTPATLAEPGGVFTFTLTITNNSVETVEITALTDTNALSAQCTGLIGTFLAAGASTSCSYTVTHTEFGSYENTASVTVEDNEGNSDTATDTETVTVTDVLPDVMLDKTVTPATLAEPGGVFTFTLTITNNSVETVEITALTDTNALSAQCTGLIGTFLAAGASTSCSYTVTHTEFGSYENTASVTVEDNEGNSDTATDTETVTVTDVLPDVMLDKTVTPATLAEPGGVFTFTLTITNNSVETVEITALTDTNALSAQCTGLIGTFLAAGASTSCSYTVTHTEFGSYENTASVTVEDNEGNSDTATDTETVTVTDVLPDVMLDKTVTPATLAEPGGVFTFTLTITNNSVETVEITALTDTNALSAECTGLVGTFLAAGASTSCSYTVTHTEFGSYENTASVTVKDNEGNSDTATDTETVTVTDVSLMWCSTRPSLPPHSPNLVVSSPSL